MPVLYLRKLTGSERSQKANRELAHFLAFIAGAANAGGYMAVKQYTSHMSGIVSAMADATAVQDLGWLATRARQRKWTTVLRITMEHVDIGLCTLTRP
jgi:uncharacterized membrane protein YoaK (UPF0700 family)